MSKKINNKFRYVNPEKKFKIQKSALRVFQLVLSGILEGFVKLCAINILKGKPYINKSVNKTLIFLLSLTN